MAKHRDFFKQFFDEKIMMIRKKSSIAKEKETENSASFSDINAGCSDYHLMSSGYEKDLFGFSCRSLNLITEQKEQKYS